MTTKHHHNTTWRYTYSRYSYNNDRPSSKYVINTYPAFVAFYRAMLYSAKRGLAIACRPSVCLPVYLSNHTSVSLSVCNVGGSGSHRLEILKTNCADKPNTFALGSPKAINLLPGEHGGILGRLEVGGKVVCWSSKVAISLKRIQMEEKILWRAYRSSSTFFRTVPPQPPTASSFPRLGVRNSTQNCNLKLRANECW